MIIALSLFCLFLISLLFLAGRRITKDFDKIEYLGRRSAIFERALRGIVTWQEEPVSRAQKAFAEVAKIKEP